MDSIFVLLGYMLIGAMIGYGVRVVFSRAERNIEKILRKRLEVWDEQIEKINKSTKKRPLK